MYIFFSETANIRFICGSAKDRHYFFIFFNLFWFNELQPKYRNAASVFTYITVFQMINPQITPIQSATTKAV